ncbi:MAG: tetratricopeptide repeat protein [Caldilineaceae bacterium]|nr:tetratricopeptide repeat protein [Caldilineaceae bacterium]
MLRLVQHQPQRASYHVAMALTAARMGSFALAEQAMQAAIALRPNDPVLYTQLAGVYGQALFESPNGSAEKVEMAYRAYDKAIALAPTIALTSQRYADFALRSGNGALALAQAQRAVDLDATDGISFAISGWTELQNGNLDMAQDAFLQAVKWRPDSADFHLGLATVYFQQGNFDAAGQAVQQSLMLDPAYPPALTLQLHLEE